MENTLIVDDFEREAQKEQIFIEEAKAELEQQSIPIQYGTIEIDWELLAREAFDFARQYIFDLIH